MSGTGGGRALGGAPGGRRVPGSRRRGDALAATRQRLPGVTVRQCRNSSPPLPSSRSWRGPAHAAWHRVRVPGAVASSSLSSLPSTAPAGGSCRPGGVRVPLPPGRGSGVLRRPGRSARQRDRIGGRARLGTGCRRCRVRRERVRLGARHRRRDGIGAGRGDRAGRRAGRGSWRSGARARSGGHRVPLGAPVRGAGFVRHAVLLAVPTPLMRRGGDELPGGRPPHSAAAPAARPGGTVHPRGGCHPDAGA